MKKIIYSTMAYLAFTVAAFGQGAPIEQWSHNYPKASQALGLWVQNHPRAAHVLFEWDASHPERSQELVNWCFADPGGDINAFVNMHPRWRNLDVFAEKHVPAMDQFMRWCRNFPNASKALMTHSRGLAWAGDHLYRESMNMQQPR